MHTFYSAFERNMHFSPFFSSPSVFIILSLTIPTPTTYMEDEDDNDNYHSGWQAGTHSLGKQALRSDNEKVEQTCNLEIWRALHTIISVK